MLWKGIFLSEGGGVKDVVGWSRVDDFLGKVFFLFYLEVRVGVGFAVGFGVEVGIIRGI